MDASNATAALEAAVEAVVRYEAAAGMGDFKAIEKPRLPPGLAMEKQLREQRRALFTTLARLRMDYTAARISIQTQKRGQLTDVRVIFGLMLVLALVLLVTFVWLSVMEVFAYRLRTEQLERTRRKQVTEERTKGVGVVEREVSQLEYDREQRSNKWVMTRQLALYASFSALCIIMLVFAKKWKTYGDRKADAFYRFEPEKDSTGDSNQLDALFNVMNSPIIGLYVLSLDPEFVDVYSGKKLQGVLKRVPNLLHEGARLGATAPDRDKILDGDAPMLAIDANGANGAYTDLHRNLLSVLSNRKRIVSVVRAYDFYGVMGDMSGAAEALQRMLLRDNDEVEGGTSSDAPLTAQQVGGIVRDELVPALRPGLVFVRNAHFARARVRARYTATGPNGEDIGEDVDIDLSTMEGAQLKLDGTEYVQYMAALRGQLLSAEAHLKAIMSFTTVQWTVPLEYVRAAPDGSGDVVDVAQLRLNGVENLHKVMKEFANSNKPGFVGWLDGVTDGDRLSPNQLARLPFVRFQVTGPNPVAARAAMQQRVVALLEENLDHPGYVLQYVSVTPTPNANGTSFWVHLCRRSRTDPPIGSAAATALEGAVTEEQIKAAVSHSPDIARYTRLELTPETDFDSFAVISHDLLDTGVIQVADSKAQSPAAPTAGAVFFPGNPMRAALAAWQPQAPLDTVAELPELYKRRILDVLARHRFMFAIRDVRDATADSAVLAADVPDAVLSAQLHQAYLDVLQEAENAAAAAAKSKGSTRFISFERFKEKMGAMRGVDIAQQLLLPVQTLAVTGRSLDQYYRNRSMFFEQQQLWLDARKLSAGLLTAVTVIWLLYYIARRWSKFKKENAVTRRLEGLRHALATGAPPPPPDGPLAPRALRNPVENVRRANKYIDEILLRMVVVAALAILVIVVMFAYYYKARGILNYNKALADYNARQLLAASSEAARQLLEPDNNGQTVDYALGPLLARARDVNLLDEPMVSLVEVIDNAVPQLKDPVRLSSEGPVRYLYDELTEALRAYESGNALLLMRGDPSFPYVDVVGNGVLLLVVLIIAVLVYRTMNPFENLSLARELRHAIEAYKKTAAPDTRRALECIVLRDSRTYEIQSLTLRVVGAVFVVFFVITYIAKVHRSGREFEASLYGSTLYRRRSAYRLA